MIKKLAKSVKGYVKESILAPVFMALEVLMEVIIPLEMSKLIDDGVYGGNMQMVYKIGLTLVIYAMLSLLFGSLSAIFASKASSGFAKNLRERLYSKVQDFSFYNIDKFSSSSLVTRLTTDVTNVQNAFMMMIRIGFRAPAMLIISLYVTISVSPKMSLIFAVILPILGICLFFITKMYIL